MTYDWKTKSNEQKVKIIEGNQGRFETVRQNYNDLWSLIVQIFRPRRYDILPNKGRKKGERYGANIFDQGPANSLHKFTSGKLGYMVNRSVPWIQFLSTDSKLMRLDHVKEYFDNAAEQTLYAAGRSNFYTSLVPSSLDADSIGTSVMIPMTDEVKDRTVFDVVHPNESYIGVDQFGDPNIYHRNPLKITRMNAVTMFGKDKFPPSWFKDGELKEILQEDDYIWAVYPNDDRDNTSALSVDKQYYTMCMLKGSGKSPSKKSRLVYESGRDYFPICYRSGRESGSSYGTSVAADCLTAALMANKLAEKSIEAAHRAVDPAKIASKTVRSSLMTAGGGRPGSTVYVDDINREGVKTWQDRLNWPVTDAQIQRLDGLIQDRMFIRFFEMLSSGDIKTRTAYEVSQMMAEKATLMSTIIDTLEQEVLEPGIAIFVLEETKAGRMPEPPEELIEADGKIDLRYLGPLAQLQRSLLRGKGTIESLDLIERMMAMSRDVSWVFNWRQMAEDVTIAQGLPQRLVTSDEQQEAQAQKAAQMQQAAVQAQLMESAGKSLPGLGKAPEEGSLMEGAAT